MMRVIAGRAKNTPLECPKDRPVRPMLARVRDAVLNIFREVIRHETVLDLFAGCGAAGIEALSRGAEWCVFVERDRRARWILEKNLARTRLAEFCDVIEGDVFRCLPRLKRIGRHPRLTIADPPYALWRESKGREDLMAFLDSLVEEEVTGERPWFVVHHDPKSPAPESSRLLRLDEQRTYGHSALTIYGLKSE